MTLPKEINMFLGSEAGDSLLLRVDLAGRVILEKTIIMSVLMFKQE